MAFDLILRKATVRNFARDVAASGSASAREALLGLGTLFALTFLSGHLRQREIQAARVQYVDPRDDDTTKLVLNPSMEHLMRKRRAA